MCYATAATVRLSIPQGDKALNVNLKQPLQAEGRADALVRERLSTQEAMPETDKQRVRRLAAHCQKYRGSVPRLAALQLLTTIVPLIAIVGAMFATVNQAYWATLLLALPAAGLLVRAFIIQHDCGHGSFFASRALNDFVGRAMSLLTLAPYGLWRREHAQHHATSGNLDRRGAGDIKTMTVAEYRKLSTLAKLQYKIYRHPAFLFGIGVPAYFVIIQRLPWLHSLAARDAWKSVLALNLGLVALYAPLCYAFGIANVLWVGLPVLHIAAAAGGWLFFIQHQFEETTWEQTEGFPGRCPTRILLLRSAEGPQLVHGEYRPAPHPPPQQHDSQLPAHGMSRGKSGTQIHQPADAGRKPSLHPSQALG